MKVNILRVFGIILMVLGGYLMWQGSLPVGAGAFAVGLIVAATSRRRSGR